MHSNPQNNSAIIQIVGEMFISDLNVLTALYVKRHSNTLKAVVSQHYEIITMNREKRDQNIWIQILSALIKQGHKCVQK